VRTLAQLVAEAYLESRKRLGFPMVQLQPAKKKRG
jgi:glycyl-tRNA synthetase alpha subunit